MNNAIGLEHNIYPSMSTYEYVDKVIPVVDEFSYLSKSSLQKLYFGTTTLSSIRLSFLMMR